MANPLMTLRSRFDESRRRHAAYRRVYGELTSMSDRDLADLGIAPGQIPEIAAEAARRA